MIDYWNIYGVVLGMERFYSILIIEIYSNIIRVCVCVCFWILIIIKFSIYWINSFFCILVKCMLVDKLIKKIKFEIIFNNKKLIIFVVNCNGFCLILRFLYWRKNYIILLY